MSSIAMVIPARLGSTRLSRKALADIHGIPMVVRVARQAALVKDLVPGVDRVIVATDAEEIKAVVEKAGFEAAMTPSELASGTDRVAYVAKNLSHDFIVNVQGDEPLIRPETIAAALEGVRAGKAPMGSVMTTFASAAEMQEPSQVKVITDKNGFAIYFSRHPIPYRMKPVNEAELLAERRLCKHMGIYAYTRSFLQEFTRLEPCFLEKWESLEQLRALYHGAKIHMGFSQHGSQSVDTAEDLEKVRKLAAKIQ